MAIFVAVAVSVASVVDLGARRTHQAARLRAESEVLSFLAGSVLRGETSLEALLERVRETFAMDAVAPLERESDVAPSTCAGGVGGHGGAPPLGGHGGAPPPERPEDASAAPQAGGRPLPSAPLHHRAGMG